MSPEKLARFADSWKYFVCPLCREELRLEGTSLRCERGHTYDVARQGYVNLAPGARQSEYYSRESFEHRGQILSAGYYSHIVDAVLSAVGRYCGQIAASIDFAGLRTRSGAQLRGARGRADLRSSGPQMRAPVILDVGCGEGFYARAVQAAHPDATVLAFDISKDSVQLAAREDAGCAVRWFVGNLAELPVRDGAVDCVLDVFSPVNYAEFARVLGGSGVVIKVVPGARHDEQLRELARGQLRHGDYSNEQVVGQFAEHFDVLERRLVSQTFPMPADDVLAFARMTPLLFNVDVDSLDLSRIHELTVEAEILVGSMCG